MISKFVTWNGKPILDGEKGYSFKESPQIGKLKGGGERFIHISLNY